MAIDVFYSVCPYGSGNIMTGNPTISISGGVATLSVAQEGNIGQGCRITYNGTSVCYISLVNSPTSFNVVTATGGTPANVSGQTVNSIAHEYASISAAIAGAMDANHLGSNDLTGIMLNIPCYYDHDDYTLINSATVIDGYTGAGPDNHIRLYAAAGGEQSIRDQRSHGLWDVERAMIYLTGPTPGTDYAITNRVPYTEIIGLQIYGWFRTPLFNDGANYAVIDQCTVWHGDSFEGQAIFTYGDGVRISNTVGIQERSDKVCRFRGNNEIVCNNILVGGTEGFVNETGAAALVVNNIAVGQSTACFSGAFAAGSDYNVSSDETAPGAHSLLNQLIADLFVDPENHDYRPKAGANTIDAGIGPALDSNVPTTDIAGNPRSGSTCSIGAFEFVDEGGTYVDLAGSIATTPQLAASLKKYVGLSGSAQITAAASSGLKATRGISGVIDGDPDIAGSLRADRRLSGEIAAAAGMDAVMRPYRGLAGSIEARAEMAGMAKIYRALVGSIAAQAGMAGVLSIAGTVELSGSIGATADMAASMRVRIGLAGQVDAQADMSGTLRPFRGVAGAIEAAAEILGAATGVRGLAGSIQAPAELSGGLSADLGLSGSIAATADISGRLRLVLSFAGSIDALADLLAGLSTFVPSTLGDPIDVTIESVTPRRAMISITIKRTITEV